MIQLHHGGVTLRGGVPTPAKSADPAGREKTMAYRILRRHDRPAGDGLLHLNLYHNFSKPFLFLALSDRQPQKLQRKLEIYICVQSG